MTDPWLSLGLLSLGFAIVAMVVTITAARRLRRTRPGYLTFGTIPCSVCPAESTVRERTPYGSVFYCDDHSPDAALRDL